MTHACCVACGLRFSEAYVAESETCPMCCGPLRLDARAAEVVGQQLYFDPPPDPLPFHRPPD